MTTAVLEPPKKRERAIAANHAILRNKFTLAEVQESVLTSLTKTARDLDRSLMDFKALTTRDFAKGTKHGMKTLDREESLEQTPEFRAKCTLEFRAKCHDDDENDETAGAKNSSSGQSVGDTQQSRCFSSAVEGE